MQERPSICCLAGAGAAPTCHRGEGTLAWHQQTRRQLSAQAPGAWGTDNDPLGGASNGPTKPVDAATGRAPWHKPDSGGGGEQACADGLGAVDESPGLSTRHGRRTTETSVRGISPYGVWQRHKRIYVKLFNGYC